MNTATIDRVIDVSQPDLFRMLVTPELAEHWIALNVSNRPVRESNIVKLVTDIQNGDYTYNAEPIKFSNISTLLDGQHRLLAIVRSGIAIDTAVSTGLSPEAQDKMDSGAKRTFSDVLKLRGEVNWTSLAATVMSTSAWDRGIRDLGEAGRGQTNSTSLKWFNEHAELMRSYTKESVELARQVPGLTAKQVSALVWAFDRLGAADDRMDFFDKLVTGVGLESGSPILALRNVLARDALSPRKSSPQHRFSLALKAWNAYRDGVHITYLRFASGGSNPEEFPEPR